MLLLIDNYDSFTYNLFQYLSELGEEVLVARNNKITLREIEELKPQHIVISPGPSTPINAGISNDVIRRFGAVFFLSEMKQTGIVTLVGTTENIEELRIHILLT